jgi:hypothetical protein
VPILNEDDLRDCFAMFALPALIEKYGVGDATEYAYKVADRMLEVRKVKDEVGIASVKRTRKVK